MKLEITKEELAIEDNIKKKVDIVCDFAIPRQSISIVALEIDIS